VSGFDPDSFFTLHADLPREGPGETADVAWAAEVAQLESGARVLDAACGPGGDIGALLRAAATGHVTALDSHAPFIAAAATRFGHHGRVSLQVGDMAAVTGPYDLIWCAGAVYFLGINAALSTWRKALADGGVIAFSEPCFFVDDPSEDARAFWDGYAAQSAGGIAVQIAAAGYDLVATRKLSDVAWESYYRPMEARIAALRHGASRELASVLDEGAAEISRWRQHRAETGYLLCVVRPK